MDTIEKKKCPYIFVCAKDDVGVSRNTVFQKIRPEGGFETVDFLKETLGGLPQKSSINPINRG